MTPLLWGCAALLATGEHTVVSHHTAAEILGGVVPHQVETHVTVRQAGR